MRIHRFLPAGAIIALLAGCAVQPAGSAGPAGSQSPPPAEPAVAPPSDPAAPAEFGLAGTSGTKVGARAAQLARDTDRLDASAGSCGTTQADIKAQRAQLATDYFNRVAQINARLQAGTTAGNPELVSAWQAARTALDSLDREAARLGDLVTSCTDDAAQATYLAESVKATMALRGGLDADRAELVRLSSRIASISSSLDQTLDLMLDDANRQNEMLLVEHRNLATLAHAVEIGQVLGSNLGLRTTAAPSWTASPRSLAPAAPRHHHAGFSGKASAATPMTAPPPPAAAPVPPTSTETPSQSVTPPQPIAYRHHHHHGAWSSVLPASSSYHHRRPLIVIQPGDESGYEHALYDAVNGVLSKEPNARFVVQASVPRAADRGHAVLDAHAAHRQADAVARSLAAFGLPQGRVVTARSVAAGGGIRVYAE